MRKHAQQKEPMNDHGPREKEKKYPEKSAGNAFHKFQLRAKDGAGSMSKEESKRRHKSDTPARPRLAQSTGSYPQGGRLTSSNSSANTSPRRSPRGGLFRQSSFGGVKTSSQLTRSGSGSLKPGTLIRRRSSTSEPSIDILLTVTQEKNPGIDVFAIQKERFKKEIAAQKQTRAWDGDKYLHYFNKATSERDYCHAVQQVFTEYSRGGGFKHHADKASSLAQTASELHSAAELLDAIIKMESQLDPSGLNKNGTFYTMLLVCAMKLIQYTEEHQTQEKPSFVL